MQFFLFCPSFLYFSFQFSVLFSQPLLSSFEFERDKREEYKKFLFSSAFVRERLGRSLLKDQTQKFLKLFASFELVSTQVLYQQSWQQNIMSSCPSSDSYKFHPLLHHPLLLEDLVVNLDSVVQEEIPHVLFKSIEQMTSQMSSSRGPVTVTLLVLQSATVALITRQHVEVSYILD